MNRRRLTYSLSARAGHVGSEPKGRGFKSRPRNHFERRSQSRPISCTGCGRQHLPEIPKHAKKLMTGRNPIETTNVVLASEIILRLYPDAVVTRILPGRFGIELVRALRTNVVMTALPMVILTSLAHSKSLEEARCSGATEVMLLPVSAEEISSRLRRHLKTQRSA